MTTTPTPAPISEERLDELSSHAQICENEFGTGVRFDEVTAGEVLELIAAYRRRSQAQPVDAPISEA